MNTLRQKLAATPRPKPAGKAAEPRQGLEIDGARDTFNPYTRVPTESAPPAKRDLRKLSEWIKMMRALEEKKKSGAAE